MATEAVAKLDFLRTHDGSQEQINPEEAQRAASNFRALCEDQLLGHAKIIYVSPDLTSFGLDRKVSLPLEVQAKDGSKLALTIESKGTEVSDHSNPFSISLQEIDEEGYGRRYVRYELQRDEKSVIRYDLIDTYKREQVARCAGDWEEGDVSIEGLERNIRRMKNEIENDKLEQQLGLNRQPVGLSEIAGLADLVGNAKVDEGFFRMMGIKRG